MEQQSLVRGSPMLPIGVVARLTGVPEMTLRNWEKRYGMPRPRRSIAGSRRLYSSDDIALVRHLAQQVANGAPIRKAIAMTRAIEREPEQLAQVLLNAALALDANAVRQGLEEAAAALAPADAWTRVMAPVLRGLGDCWVSGDEMIAAEHLASSAILAWLQSLMVRYQPLSAPRTAVACGPGELHELGSLALAALVTLRGTPMVYLGANTPFTALDDIHRHMNLRILCVTATTRATADHLVEILARLAEPSTETVLAYGGPGFDDHDAAHQRLVGSAFYLGSLLEDAVTRVEHLCTANS